MNQEDATSLLIEWCTNPEHEGSVHEYEIYIPALLRGYLRKSGTDQPSLDARIRELMPLFLEAKWQLCHRGILRPGKKIYDAGATSENGCSITPFGRTWLSGHNDADHVPTEPGSIASMLADYNDIFGPGYAERAQEASTCYFTKVYLACCAMTGAASESILLATAIKKSGDEKTILAQYSTSHGRSRIEKQIFGQAKPHLTNEYNRLSGLLKYWRDASSHGKKAEIQHNEAFTSLLVLLKLAIFMSNNWAEITAQ